MRSQPRASYPCKNNQVQPDGWHIHNQLAKVNKGPVGPKYNNGLQDGIYLSTLPIQKTPPKSVESEPTRAGISRDLRDDLKRGNNRASDPTGEWVLLHPFSCTKKDGGQRPVINLKNLHTCPSFQNGGNPYPQKPVKKGRLDCKDRPKGRLFLSPDKSKLQEVSLLPIQQQVLPIQLSPLRPGLSPMGLYKTLKPIAALG